MLGIGRFNRFLYDRNMRQIHHDHRIMHEDEYHNIVNILIEFRATGGLKHDFQAYKLFSLRQILLNERPQKIIEFGTGTTTALFAEYVRQYGGVLHSIDESHRWLSNSMNIAGIKPDDRRFVMKQADRSVVFQDGEPSEFNYDVTVNESGFDLVLIDGPSMKLNGQRYKEGVNLNILSMIDEDSPKVILVDIRAATVEHLKTSLMSNYNCRISDVILKRTVQDYRYFSEFTRV